MKQIKLIPVKSWFLLTISTLLLVITSCTQAQENSNNETKIKAPKSTIIEATFLGNTADVKGHIAAKTDLNQKDPYGSTPLHIAITFGKTEVALLLINGGANLNEKNGTGATPLHTAAFFGRTDIVKALLKNNADTEVLDNNNFTALQSVSAPFDNVKPIYDQISKSLGPFGLKLNYNKLKEERPVIAQLLSTTNN